MINMQRQNLYGYLRHLIKHSVNPDTLVMGYKDIGILCP